MNDPLVVRLAAALQGEGYIDVRSHDPIELWIETAEHVVEMAAKAGLRLVEAE